MAKPRKTERITFRLTEEQKRRLDRMADRARKDTGEYVRDLVVRAIEIEKAA